MEPYMSAYKRSDQGSQSSFSIISKTHRRVLILIMSFLSAILDRRGDVLRRRHRRCGCHFCVSSLADYAEDHLFPAAEPFSDYLIIILPLVIWQRLSQLYLHPG